MIRALLVKSDDDEPEVVVKDWTLEETQTAVGGLIRSVYPDDFQHGWQAFVNDDGMELRLPQNFRATRLAAAAGYRPWPSHYVLRGPVVFFGSVDDEGDLTSVPESVLGLATLAEVPQ